ncbi:MAG: hypothetical protein ABJE95_31625 [Byssovorax sp.]
MTDFQFPPHVTGTWRPLSRLQREQWLIAACNRHFKRMRRRGGWKDADAGAVFAIDGAATKDYPAFLCALGEAINGPGGYFGGLSSSSLQDCLFGAFGVTLPFVLRIVNADACREALDGPALADRARRALVSGDFLDDEGKQWWLEAERNGLEGSRCLFDEVLEEIRFHGVTIELEEFGGSA